MLGPQDQENYGLREIRPGSRPQREVFFRKWDPWWYAICDEEGGTVLRADTPLSGAAPAPRFPAPGSALRPTIKVRKVSNAAHLSSSNEELFSSPFPAALSPATTACCRPDGCWRLRVSPRQVCTR